MLFIYFNFIEWFLSSMVSDFFHLFVLNRHKIIHAQTFLREMYLSQWQPVFVVPGDLKSFLADPGQGGAPQDLKVVNDIPAFVERHADVFVYDAATTRLSLRAVSNSDYAIDLMAEARVVQRLMAKLQTGPGQAAAHLQNNVRL